jgi:hypothetical protein
MLTKRENLLETIKGGNPDRFVNQYEFMEIIMEVPLVKDCFLEPGTERKNKIIIVTLTLFMLVNGHLKIRTFGHEKSSTILWKHHPSFT